MGWPLRWSAGLMARSVVVLGGGLSGMAAAYTLARAGGRQVTVLERGPELGGLAGTFEHAGHFYPLAYHHILGRDRTLLYFLDLLGVSRDVQWRRIRMLFHHGGALHELGAPRGFLSFPMGLWDKACFARLMLRCFRKSDWSDWQDHSAAELIDRWGSPGVRRTMFEPLTRLKFDLPCSEASGAWLGARMHFREGSSPLGYIPGTNWTKVLCEGLSTLLEKEGVSIRVSSPVARLHVDGSRVTEVELVSGERLAADCVVSTVPPSTYFGLVPRDASPELGAIRYTAVISMICATTQQIAPEFYWMNLTSLDCSAGGIFKLNSLNPTIGGPGETCLNFVTHLSSRDHEVFQRSDAEILAGYLDDFRRIWHFDLRPSWTRLTRLAMYSPVFVRGYHNPPVRSTTWTNVYFAGNYRTFPSIASTGTALASGLEAGRALLQDAGDRTELPEHAYAFRARTKVGPD